MHRARLLLAACTLLAVAVGTRPGRADDDHEAAARAIFDQATRDMYAGAYDKACPALLEVVKLTRGIGAMIKLGKCYEGQGKLASAWASFKEAAEAAHLARDGRETAADAKAQELFPKLSRLSITVGAGTAGVAGLLIQRDDVDLLRAQWNTEVPVDPGRHVVTVSAPGRKTWTGTVDVPAAGGNTTLDVPLLEDAAPSVAPSVPDTSAIAPTPAPAASLAERPPSAHRKSYLRPIGVAAGAAGLVAIGIGSYFGVEVFNAKSQPSGVCNSTGCNTSGSARQSALREGDASTALFIAGGALVATGVTLWLVAPSGRSSSSAWRVVPGVTPSSGSLAMSGSF
jgi:hypothetical protein